MIWLRIIGFVFQAILLTVFTQVGGIVLCLLIPFFRFLDRNIEQRRKRILARAVVFFTFYGMVSAMLVPTLASLAGRVPLPTNNATYFQPLNILTVACNRHYVTPKMKTSALRVAEKMNAKYPGTTIAYLDANFPFFDGFPLLPHLSHNDGRKLDVALLYTDTETGDPVNGDAPSFIGYGVHEGPRNGESNMPKSCAKKGHWWYGALESVVPQGSKASMTFDEKRTATLVNLLAAERNVEKIFIEPHLKSRMGLSSSKIRYHGCHAVRHDDHVHFQVRR